jgi:glycerophosphoryl diester phosphodiesterase
MDDPEYQPPCQFVQSPWDISSQAFIDRAHDLGLKVHPWTVDESGLMTELIGRGVDGIMTDDPELLAQVAG